MENDKDQQRAIEIRRNAVVSAGAGSGKTKVLAERFTHLIQSGDCTVEEILTLTFTKKATVEMNGRIYKALNAADPESAKDFYKAHIHTLDSYCATIARQGAHFYGISPQFIPDNDQVADLERTLALPFILEHQDNPAIRLLAQTKDFSQIAEELLVQPLLEHTTIAEPIDFAAAVERQRQNVREAWNTKAQKTRDTLSQFIHRFAEETEGRSGTQIKAIRDVIDSTGIPEPPPLDGATFTEETARQVIDYLRQMNRYEQPSQPTAKGLDGSKELLKELYDELAELSSLATYITSYDTTKETCGLLAAFQAQVNEAKRSAGVLTFQDIASLALKILMEHPEIRAMEKKKYKAIMIDEFQDNNALQRDLLFLLAEKQERMEAGLPALEELCPDKLFFVGDEKQSIYRFRGADVSVFRKLKESFPDGALSLQTNYRSNPALIAAFNSLFGGADYPFPNGSDTPRPSIFCRPPADAQGLPAYEAQYTMAHIPPAKRESATFGGDKPIHIALLPRDADGDAEHPEQDKDALGNDENEAVWVANKIRELLSQKDVKPSDIAILLRTTTKQPVFERTLLQYGIPYTSQSIKDFFQDGPVNDLFSFLCLCAYPADRNAYCTLLRSPFVQLSMEEALSVLDQLPENISQTDLFTLQSETSLTPEGRERFEKMAPLFQEIWNFSQTAPLTQTVTKLWYDMGYRYETLWNRKVMMYHYAYDFLFELARQAQDKNQGLAAFVDRLRQFQDPDSRFEGLNIPLDREDGVHIMTIHASKGLEYPYVFVGAISSPPRNAGNTGFVFMSKEFGITINTPQNEALAALKHKSKRFRNTKNFFYQQQLEEEKKEECAELRRLFYVAATRAERKLFLTGNYKQGDLSQDAAQDDADEQKAPTTIYQLLLPALRHYGIEDNPAAPYGFEPIGSYERDEPKELSITAVRNEHEEKRRLLQEITGTYEATEATARESPASPYIAPSQLYDRDDETEGGSDVLFDETAPYQEINRIVQELRPRFTFSQFGTIAHTYLEAAINNTSPLISNKDILGLENDTKKLRVIQSACTAMQQAFIASDVGRQAQRAPWHKAEYAFRSRVASKIIRGTIDLVFKHADDDDYSIVDYKTNQRMQPQLYTLQLACYRQAVSQILSCPPEKIHCYLYYLRFDKMIDISDACAAIHIEEHPYFLL